MRHNTKGKPAHAIARFHLYRLARRIAGPAAAYRLSRSASTVRDNVKAWATVAGGAVAIHAVFMSIGVI